MKKYEVVESCDGFLENYEARGFHYREEAERLLARIAEDYGEEAEVLWAKDADGEPVLVLNAEQWCAVFRVTEEEN